MEPLNSAGNFRMKNSYLVNPIGAIAPDAEEDNFGDLGIELCPVSEKALSDFDLEFDKNCIKNEKADDAARRSDGWKLEASDFSEAIPGGHNHVGTAGGVLDKKMESAFEEHMKLDKSAIVNYLVVGNADFPSELKCPLCNTFFREAVMIPCCQHSFCEKCIRLVLVDEAKCPKCSSSKCRVEDLLPNLSLRQAIQHFLESQILHSSQDDALHKYAPDGESGIHANDVSCALTVFQKGANFPNSPSATEQGSNQIMEGSVLGGCSFRKSNLPVGKALEAPPLSHGNKEIGGERVEYAHKAGFQIEPGDLATAPEFQGENQPRGNEEADSFNKRKRGFWVNPGGGNRSPMPTGRHGKGQRNCYMCGSPDHLIRDCPDAFSQHPMSQTGNVMFPGALPGYSSPFWNGTPLPPIRPFANIYGSPGMMPFDATMVPVTPFAVHSYMPSFYGGLPSPSGFLRNGGSVPLVGRSTEYAVNHSEIFELQDCENRQKVWKEDLPRGRDCDDADDCHRRFHGCEPDRSREYKCQMEKAKFANGSEDSFTRRSQKKYGHDVYLDHNIDAVDGRPEKSPRSSVTGRNRRHNHLERSSSGGDDVRSSSDGHEHRHWSSKKHERKVWCDSDSDVERRHSGTRSHHQTNKEKDVGRRREELDSKGHVQKHHNHPDSGLGPHSSSYQKERHRKKDSSYNCRHSRHSRKPNKDERFSDRCHMSNGFDEDYRDNHHHHKRKRVH